MAVGSTLTFWKQCEGQVVDGQFPLRQYLGGSDHSAVFLTQRGKPVAKKAAIKLLRIGAAAEDQLSRWQAAGRLSHPHLLQLFETGRCQFDNENYFYVVMDYAEEDLSEILPTRALSTAEAQEMLSPLMSALRHIHSQGLVHGHIKPANIMAINDQLKLSSDSISPAGKAAMTPTSQMGVYDAPECKELGKTAASDMWALGMTLVEVLTQRPAMREGAQGELLLPQTMPMPFREIAAQCLRRDPRERWTIDQIQERLHPEKDRKPSARHAATATRVADPTREVDPEEAPKRRLRPAVAVVIVLVAILVLLKFMRRPSGGAPVPSNPVARSQSSQPPGSETRTVPGNPKPTASTPGATHSGRFAGAAGSGRGGGNADIVEQVMPDVSRGATNTITGTIKINVRVNVDPSGSVSDAQFERRGPSDYFARKSMEAARKWKFTPNASRAWVLHFELRRSGVRVIPQPVGS
jgi:TonB family protein